MFWAWIDLMNQRPLLYGVLVVIASIVVVQCYLAGIEIAAGFAAKKRRAAVQAEIDAFSREQDRQIADAKQTQARLAAVVSISSRRDSGKVA